MEILTVGLLRGLIGDRNIPALQALVTGKPDEEILDLIDRNDYIVTKVWSNEDAQNCLIEAGYIPSAENVNTLAKMAELHQLEDCTEYDWNIWNKAVKGTEDELEPAPKYKLVCEEEDILVMPVIERLPNDNLEISLYSKDEKDEYDCFTELLTLAINDLDEGQEEIKPSHRNCAYVNEKAFPWAAEFLTENGIAVPTGKKYSKGSYIRVEYDFTKLIDTYSSKQKKTGPCLICGQKDVVLNEYGVCIPCYEESIAEENRITKLAAKKLKEIER